MCKKFRHRLRPDTASVALAAAATMLAACTSELASFDDIYIPQSVEENFPITVVEQSAKLAIEAHAEGLRNSDMSELVRFGRQAAARATTPVTVGYSATSKHARQVANQAAEVVVRQGVPRGSVLVTPHDGRDGSVILVFGTKVAQSKPCGDWSENLRGNQFNGSGPNFGCTVQQNIAAMVADPSDLERPKPMTPTQSSSQSVALEAYNKGVWTTPTVTTTTASGQ